MRFVECVDYGDVKTQVIAGVASIRLVNHGEMIEVRFYETGEGTDGRVEYRLAARHVWPMSLWMMAGRVRDAFLEQFSSEGREEVASIAAH
jgi:hypothetical protein